MTTEIREIKSSLAKLLATENITVQFAAVETASFDVKNRVLLIPTYKDMSSECLDLFVGHEVGHALWTPCDGILEHVKDKDFHTFMNVVEDVRIERKIQAKYPGLKKQFFSAYGQLNDGDFFGVKNMDTKDMLFIDRLNLKAKLGVRFEGMFNEVEQDFYTRSQTTETFEEVIALAKEIYEYCKQEQEEKQQGQDKGDERKVNPEESVEFQESKSEDASEGTSEFKMTSQGGEEESTEEEETGGSAEQPTQEDENAEDTAEEKIQSELPLEDMSKTASEVEGSMGGVRSITDMNSQSNAKDLVETDEDMIMQYIDLPKKIDFDKFIISYQTMHNELNEYWKDYSNRDSALAQYANVFKKRNQKVINYLNKEFEMKKAANEYVKASEAKTGVINTQKLYSYKFNEDIFKKATQFPKGKDHGMVFFLDWSGSMSENMKGTMEQLVCLAMFCKKANIPFAAYAFTSEYFKNQNLPKYERQSQNYGELAFDPKFGLLELFNEKMNTKNFNKSVEICLAISCMFDRNTAGDFRWWGLPRKYFLSGTPLNECIMFASKFVPEFKKRNSIQIVNTVFLTDGSSHSFEGVFSTGTDLDLGHIKIDAKPMHSKNVTIRDKATNTQIQLKTDTRYRPDMTKALYQFLKSVTGCNLVGFFIASGSDIRYAFDKYVCDATSVQGYHDQQIEFKKQLNKDKSIVSYTSGMDELYILKGGKTLQINDEGLKVDSNASKGQLTTAFKKMTKGKLQNRVILSKFIDRVAA
jgi:hypothetical protein